MLKMNNDEIFTTFKSHGIFSKGDHMLITYPTKGYGTREVFVRCDDTGRCQVLYYEYGYKTDHEEAIPFPKEQFAENLKTLFGGVAQYVNPLTYQKLLLCAREKFREECF